MPATVGSKQASHSIRFFPSYFSLKYQAYISRFNGKFFPMFQIVIIIIYYISMFYRIWSQFFFFTSDLKVVIHVSIHFRFGFWIDSFSISMCEFVLLSENSMFRVKMWENAVIETRWMNTAHPNISSHLIELMIIWLEQ